MEIKYGNLDSSGMNIQTPLVLYIFQRSFAILCSVEVEFGRQRACMYIGWTLITISHQ